MIEQYYGYVLLLLMYDWSCITCLLSISFRLFKEYANTRREHTCKKTCIPLVCEWFRRSWYVNFLNELENLGLRWHRKANLGGHWLFVITIGDGVNYEEKLQMETFNGYNFCYSWACLSCLDIFLEGTLYRSMECSSGPSKFAWKSSQWLLRGIRPPESDAHWNADRRR